METLELVRRLGQNRLLDGAAAVVAVVSLIQVARMLPDRAVEYDFAHEYVWSRMLMEQANPYRMEAGPWYAKYGFRFQASTPVATYTPVALRAFAPLAMLRPSQAYGAWVGVELASLGMLLWLTKRVLRGKLSARGWYFVCVGAITSRAVYFHFAYAQVQLSLAALMLLAFEWRKEQKYAAACTAVTAAGMLKLFPFVLLPWFLWRSGGGSRRRLFLAALVVAEVALVVLCTSPALWRDFFVYSGPVLQSWAIHNFFNFSVSSLITHCGYALHGFSHLTTAAARPWWTVGLVSGGVLIVVAYAVCVRTAADPEMEFSLLCCVMLAGSAIVWMHYLVILIFPMAVAATRVAANPSVGAVAFLASLIFAFNSVATAGASWLHLHPYWKTAWNFVPLYGMLALAVFFSRQMRSAAPV